MIRFAIQSTIYLLLFVYGFIPIAVKVYPHILRKVVFLDSFSWPPFLNLSDVNSFDLPPTRNFYLTTDTSVSCGVWHILPKSVHVAKDQRTKKEVFLKYLLSSYPIVLYLHGNAGTRGSSHRVDLYKLLSLLDFHVIAVDYRGYGDSTGSPTEQGVIQDALSTYEWIQAHASPTSRIIVWGHSLGSSIATAVSAKMSSLQKPPSALILEAPFTNIADAAMSHPFSVIYRALPYFNWVFISSLEDLEIHFSSDKTIVHVSCPVLILHAVDDEIVPYHLGQKLYLTAEEELRKMNPKHIVRFISFDAVHKYGHKHIHRDTYLGSYIREFYAAAVTE